MDKEKGPLLFIESVTVINENKKKDKIFVSEGNQMDHQLSESVPLEKEKTEINDNNVEIKNEEENIETLETRKLKNILEMYKKNRPVLCNIITKTEEVVGVPYLKNENTLTVKVTETEDKKVSLHDILEINIIKF